MNGDFDDNDDPFSGVHLYTNDDAPALIEDEEAEGNSKHGRKGSAAAAGAQKGKEGGKEGKEGSKSGRLIVKDSMPTPENRKRAAEARDKKHDSDGDDDGGDGDDGMDAESDDGDSSARKKPATSAKKTSEKAPAPRPASKQEPPRTNKTESRLTAADAKAKLDGALGKLEAARKAEAALKTSLVGARRRLEEIEAAIKEKAALSASIKNFEAEIDKAHKEVIAAEAAVTKARTVEENVEDKARPMAYIHYRGIDAKVTKEEHSALEKCFETEGLDCPPAEFRTWLVTKVNEKINEFMSATDPVEAVTKAKLLYESRRQADKTPGIDGKYSLVPPISTKVEDMGGSSMAAAQFRGIAIFLTRYDDTSKPMVCVKPKQSTDSGNIYNLFCKWMITCYSKSIPTRDPLLNFKGHEDDEEGIFFEKLAEFTLRMAFFVIRSNELIEITARKRAAGPSATAVSVTEPPTKKAKTEPASMADLDF